MAGVPQWRGVTGYIDPQLLNRKSYGDVLGQVGGAINTFADATRQQNTDAALLQVANAPTQAALKQQLPEMQALLANSGRTINQQGVLDAITARDKTLETQELAESRKNTSRDLAQLQLFAPDAPLADIQTVARQKGDRSTYDLYNDFIQQQTLRQQAAEDRKVTQQKGLLDSLNIQQQMDIRANEQTIKVSELGARYPDAVTTERIENGDGTYQEVQKIKPGFLQNFNALRTNSGLPAIDNTGAVVSGKEQKASSSADPRWAKYQGSVSPVVLGMIGPESSGNHVDPKTGKLTESPKGARGLTQFIPSTRQMILDKYGVDAYKDEESAVKAADLYHKENLKAFGNDEAKAVAAYNAGPGRIRQAIASATAAGNPANWLAYTPKETQEHVPKVLNSASAYGYQGGSPSSNTTVTTTTSGGGKANQGDVFAAAVKGTSIRDTGNHLNTARQALADLAAAEKAKAKVNIASADASAESLALTEYIRDNELLDSSVYRSVHTKKWYKDASAAEKLAAAKAMSNYEKAFDKKNGAIGGFFKGMNLKEAENIARTEVEKSKKASIAAKRKKDLTALITQAEKTLPFLRKDNPNITLDDIIPHLNKDLAKMYQGLK